MQRITAILDTGVATHELPDVHDEIVPGLQWGRFDHLFTPAFWASRGWLHSTDSRFNSFRLGVDLREEVTACILGGFGISAEIGLAAYYRIRTRGLISSAPSVDEIYESLAEPLLLGSRIVRYRFPRQRSARLARALMVLDVLADYETSRGLRDSLLQVPGIGPKTASWIVRNHTASDDVAILDIHVCRACVLAGVFREDYDISRDYFGLEKRFLDFAQQINVRASVLDAVMWHHMRNLGSLGRSSH